MKAKLCHHKNRNHEIANKLLAPERGVTRMFWSLESFCLPWLTNWYTRTMQSTLGKCMFPRNTFPAILLDTILKNTLLSLWLEDKGPEDACFQGRISAWSSAIEVDDWTGWSSVSLTGFFPVKVLAKGKQQVEHINSNQYKNKWKQNNLIKYHNINLCKPVWSPDVMSSSGSACVWNLPSSIQQTTPESLLDTW